MKLAALGSKINIRAVVSIALTMFIPIRSNRTIGHNIFRTDTPYSPIFKTLLNSMTYANILNSTPKS